MSNFQEETRHPETGVLYIATHIDDYFGRHQYGVQFPDGKVFRRYEIHKANMRRLEGSKPN